GAGIERQNVFLSRFGVHRDQEIDLFLPGDVPALAGSNRVPGREPGDVRREHVLAGHRNAHEEKRPQEHQVGGLAAGSVDGCDLNAEIVDDALAARFGGAFLNGYIARWHSYPWK